MSEEVLNLIAIVLKIYFNTVKRKNTQSQRGLDCFVVVGVLELLEKCIVEMNFESADQLSVSSALRWKSS